LEKEQQIETLSNSLKQLNDLKKENKIELDKLRQENSTGISITVLRLKNHAFKPFLF